jgi:sugar lactone lactonase YvrE
MFIVGYANDSVYEYTLSTGFDVSTSSFVDSFSVASQETFPTGIAFNTDGSKMFVAGYNGSDVNEYSVGSTVIPTGYHPVHTTASIDSTYWTDINSMTADQAAGNGNVYYAISTDDRTTWTVIDNTDGERDIVRNNAGTWQYNSNGTYASETWANGTTNTELATLAEAMEGAVGGYGLANASYDSVSFNSSGQTSLPIGLVFNNDGTKMFIADYSGQDINEYTLSSAFDITTASFVDSFNVSSQETQPLGMAFNTDGTKMFVVGLTGDDVNEYTLSTGFDVSTASFVDSFSVSAQDTQPAGVKFNTDGTKMFVVGYTNDAVYEYNLSTGFDVSSASFVDSFSVSAQAVLPIDLAFNPDGTSMFIVDYTGQDVNEYSLSTAFDISSASFVSNFSVSSQDTQPRSVAFNENGSKMFLLGSTNYSVYQYSTVSFTKPNGQDSTRRCYRPEPHSSW